ncbi:hypothetical protein ACPCBC_33135 [Streptomyces incarnatus]
MLDLVGLIGDLVGGGSDPGMDIEDLLANHGELLEAILAGQQDLLEGVGGVSGQVGRGRWARWPGRPERGDLRRAAARWHHGPPERRPLAGEVGRLLLHA